MVLDPLVFLLVLAAAVMHAAWNAMIKAGEDRLVRQTFVTLAPAFVTLPALFFLPPMAPGAWPWLFTSASIHCLYYVALLGAYRHGDLSKVYPIARGSAPGLVAVGAWLVAGESVSLLELLGLAILSAGLMALAWRPRRQARQPGERPAVLYALMTGLTIAAYSLADGQGVRASGGGEARFTYIAWLFTIDSLPLVAFTLWKRRGQLRVRRQDALYGSLGGLISALAYGIVIWAMSVAPMTHVVALRETSVLFAALIGTRLLAEPFGRRRMAAACVIVAGAALLQVSRGL